MPTMIDKVAKAILPHMIEFSNNSMLNNNYVLNAAGAAIEAILYEYKLNNPTYDKDLLSILENEIAI